MEELKLKGNNELETQKLYENYYIDHYIISKNNEKIIIKTSDGIKVEFYNTNNIHAYTRSKPLSNTKRDRIFDFERARKLNFIKEVIEETCTEEVLKKDFFNEEKKFGKDIILYLKKNIIFI